MTAQTVATRDVASAIRGAYYSAAAGRCETTGKLELGEVLDAV